ncbi:MAG: hypothetical protein LIP04_07415 [Tannerellaceae bacterium]|nr:hypothetical protein [Tannerellaceae bacterium]
MDSFHYIGTLTNGLFVTDQQGTIVAHATEDFQLQDNMMHAITNDHPDQVWMAFDNGITSLTLHPAIQLLGKRNQLGKLTDAFLRDDHLYIHTHTGYYVRSMGVCRYFRDIPEEQGAPLFAEKPHRPVFNSIEELFTNPTQLDVFARADQIYQVSEELYWLTYENEAGLFAVNGGDGTLKCRILFDNYKLNLVTRGNRIIPLNDSLHIFSTLQEVVMVNTDILIRKGTTQGMPHRFAAITYIQEDSLKFLPPEMKEISLPYNFQQLNLYVGSTTLTPNNQISYKIEHMSSGWSDWQKSGHISLLQLPEGIYALKVRKYVPTGEFPELSLQIHVLPPWYNTIWAHIIYVMIIFGMVQLFASLYFSHQRKEEKKAAGDPETAGIKESAGIKK